MFEDKGSVTHRERVSYEGGVAPDEHLKALRAAAEKPAKRLLQFDGFIGIEQPDAVMRPDADSDCLFTGETVELTRSLGPMMPVRVLVHPGADSVDVMRLLGKIRECIGRDGIRRIRNAGTVDVRGVDLESYTGARRASPEKHRMAGLKEDTDADV